VSVIFDGGKGGGSAATGRIRGSRWIDRWRDRVAGCRAQAMRVCPHAALAQQRSLPKAQRGRCEMFDSAACISGICGQELRNICARCVRAGKAQVHHRQRSVLRLRWRQLPCTELMPWPPLLREGACETLPRSVP
jgi:hypothetical protein